MKYLFIPVATIAIVFFACSGDDPSPAATTVGHSDRDAALDEIRSRFPGMVPAIEAVESEDAAAILDSLRWEEIECTPDGHRGGPALRCSELGLPQWTMVRMFHYELLTTSYFTEDQMRGRIDEYLIGRNPELALVATHPSGQWLLSFIVDDTAGEGLRAMDFRADGEGGAPLTSHKERFDASTPLDTLREAERNGQAWEIVYTSDALLAWDAE